MPLYVYEIILPDGSAGETFEWLQPLSAEPFTHHPETGEPVRRVIGVPNAPKQWTSSQMQNATSDKNLDRLGFTKYVKGGSGRYEKRFGKGPNLIKKPPKQS